MLLGAAIMFYVGSKFVAEVKISPKSFVVRYIIYLNISIIQILVTR